MISPGHKLARGREQDPHGHIVIDIRSLELDDGPEENAEERAQSPGGQLREDSNLNKCLSRLGWGGSIVTALHTGDPGGEPTTAGLDLSDFIVFTHPAPAEMEDVYLMTFTPRLTPGRVTSSSSIEEDFVPNSPSGISSLCDQGSLGTPSSAGTNARGPPPVVLPQLKVSRVLGRGGAVPFAPIDAPWEDDPPDFGDANGPHCISPMVAVHIECEDLTPAGRKAGGRRVVVDQFLEVNRNDFHLVRERSAGTGACSRLLWRSKQKGEAHGVTAFVFLKEEGGLEKVVIRQRRLQFLTMIGQQPKPEPPSTPVGPSPL